MEFGNKEKNHLKAEKQDSCTQTFSLVSAHRSGKMEVKNTQDFEDEK